jgi:hypothetical protein
VAASSQGIGKDSLLAPIINGNGPWNAQDIAPKTLLGQFNTYARAMIAATGPTMITAVRGAGAYGRH